jgi:trigger factor
MDITRENIDNVNAVIRVVIEKPDYEKTVEDSLKEYRQKAAIPGFRPGKAPMGLVRKKIGKSVVVEEINKMLSQNLTRYLMEEKIQILGEPLGSADHQKPIDWDNDENFEFAFDVALSPEIVLELDENLKLDFYTIKVTEDMIDKQMEMITSQLGESKDVDEVTEKTLVRGDFTELDEEGNEMEEGIRAEEVLLSVDLIKNDEIKKQFIGKKQGDEIVFNPVVAYEDKHEVGHLLKISHERANELDSSFRFKVNEIQIFEKAELNEELYKKIYGEDTEIKTEEDLRNRLKEEIAGSLLQASDRRFATDTRDLLVEKVNPELPETFLRRWLREVNQELTEEQIEKDFDGFMKDLRWQLIKGYLIKENDLKVEEEEAFEFAKKLAQAQYHQYGIYDAQEEQLESFAKMILEKPEEKEKLHNKLLEDKIVAVVKDKITVENKEVTREEFEEMAK